MENFIFCAVKVKTQVEINGSYCIPIFRIPNKNRKNKT